MRTRLHRFWKLWCEFWFDSYSPATLRLFRVALAGMLFVYYGIRTFDLELFFSSTGIMPLSAINDVIEMKYRHSLLFYFTSNGALWFFHVFYLASLAALVFGFWPRAAAIIAYVLHVSFMHRNMAPSYGVDLISTFFLFYFCFASYRPKETLSEFTKSMGSMAYRLMQIQVCIIYAYSGLDKVKGMPWWHGEALWTVVANAQIARFDFTYMAHFPLVIIALTYMTLAWEIYFPVLVWLKPVRNFVLIFGVLTHIGIAIVINIPFFGMLMILTYILFLDKNLINKLDFKVRKFVRI